MKYPMKYSDGYNVLDNGSMPTLVGGYTNPKTITTCATRYINLCVKLYIYGLAKTRSKSSALAARWRLSYINPRICIAQFHGNFNRKSQFVYQDIDFIEINWNADVCSQAVNTGTIIIGFYLEAKLVQHITRLRVTCTCRFHLRVPDLQMSC